MKAILTRYKKTVLLAMTVGLLSFGTAIFAREGIDATRDAIQKALRAARSRQQRVTVADADSQERCGICGKPKPKGADIAGDNAQERCGCSKPKPKGEELNDTQDRCGCSKPKPKTQERCDSCEEEVIKQSVADVLEQVLAVAATIAKRRELDRIDLPSAGRAPREALDDPCNACEVSCVDIPCPSPCPEEIDCCDIIRQLACMVQCQGHAARKCCKKIKHELKDIEELVESQLDQSIECCSIIETTLGDPGNSALDIPDCSQVLSIVDVIDSTNVDVITWLKSIYLLLFQVYQCACTPCLQ